MAGRRAQRCCWRPDNNDAKQAAAPDAKGAGANDGYLAEREKTEKYRALAAERDYLESIGALVPAAEVQKVAFTLGRTLREQLMGIPDRLAPQLAAEREPAAVHAALSKELKQVLNEFASRLPNPGVAAGAA